MNDLLATHLSTFIELAHRVKPNTHPVVYSLNRFLLPSTSTYLSISSILDPLPHLAPHNNTPIRMQTLPTNKTTIRTGQKHKTSSHLARLSWSSHRTRELLLRLLVHGSWDERCPNRAGTDGIDADSVFDLLVGESAREGYDGSFGGGVIEEVGAPDVVVYGGAGYDCGAAGHYMC